MYQEMIPWTVNRTFSICGNTMSQQEPHRHTTCLIIFYTKRDRVKRQWAFFAKKGDSITKNNSFFQMLIYNGFHRWFA